MFLYAVNTFQLVVSACAACLPNACACRRLHAQAQAGAERWAAGISWQANSARRRLQARIFFKNLLFIGYKLYILKEIITIRKFRDSFLLNRDITR